MPTSQPPSTSGSAPRRYSRRDDQRPILSSPLIHSIVPSTSTSSSVSPSDSPSTSPQTSESRDRDPFSASNSANVAPFAALRTTGGVGSNSRFSREAGFASGLHPKLSPVPASSATFGGPPMIGRHVGGGGAEVEASLMQRVNSGSGAAVHRERESQKEVRQSRREDGAPPVLLRRRSSGALHASLLLGDEKRGSTSNGSAGMERQASLTSFMKTGGQGEKRRDGGAGAGGSGAAAGPPRIHRRRLYTSLTRLLGLMTLALLSLYLLKKIVSTFLLPSSFSTSDLLDAETVSSPWLPASHRLFDTLETIPYDVKTHPRTPSAREGTSLSLAEYLDTRLGSHFSFPSANLPGRTTRGSQLWLTTATNRSVTVSTRHLVAFAKSLDGSTPSISRLSTSTSSDHKSTSNSSSSSSPSTPSPPLLPRENRDQSVAQRIVVTLCRDEACLDSCRQDEELYCFGGFARGGKRGKAKEGLDKENGDEVAKLRAAVETLESGRRLFWADEGVYFRHDPVPYMGDLSSYDLQIPDTWSSSHIDAGYFFVNPTQRTISLFRKLLSTSLLSSSDRLSWSTTNLLLDPIGQFRSSEAHEHHSAPVHSAALDENLFEDEGDLKEGKSEYGQVEFESPWDGGLDVRVLDAKRFKTSEGRLGRKVFDFEKKKGADALYWHCACCGDEYTNDYIAGALGFHQPSVSYNLHSLTDVPTLPLVLKTPALHGTPAQLRYATGLLLQLAYDSSRTFVPPLTVSIVESNAGRTLTSERYIFRTFPVARWAHPTAPTTSTIALGSLPRDLKVGEPGYVQHAAEHLKSTFPDRPEATRLVAELTETLFLDVRKISSLKEFTHSLTRPFWSTERIISLEGVVEVMEREGWELRPEFGGVAMCQRGEKMEKTGTCSQLCPL